MRCLCFLLFFLPAIASHAQYYYVVSVQDSVWAYENPLRPGDKLEADTPLRFGSPAATAYLLSPNQGYFQLAPSASADDSRTGLRSNELVVALRNALVPPTKQYLTATRSDLGVTFKNRYDLMGFFQDDVLLVSETHYALTTPTLDSTHYLLVQTPGQEDLPATTVKGGFTLPEALFEASPAPHALYLMADGERTHLGTFVPHLRTRAQLVDELRPFFTLQPDLLPRRVYADQVRPYLHQAYGHYDELGVMNLLEASLDVVL
ncbi:MAG: hypothetical protein WBA12_03335 [Catalinimonas sp.]